CDAFSGTGEDFDEIRQVVAGNEVLNFLSGLSEAHFSRQMALLADRIAKTGSEFPRVYESRVVGRRAVASDALDSRHDLAVPVEGARFQHRPIGVTEQAIGRDGPAQVWRCVVLV